jgi:hypothetical protein
VILLFRLLSILPLAALHRLIEAEQATPEKI